jgi:MYXO-CTERM domain-containing protein
MKFTAFALAAAVTSVSSANFVSYVVTKTSTTNSGVALDVYTLWARFDGPTDTILNAFNFNRVDGSAGNMFYHKDNASYNSGVLQQEFGTWNPSQTGNAAANRPFDSYLTIGNQAVGTNPTQADPSWPSAGGSWDRADLPSGFNIGWFNPNPPNFQGRVGVGANTATDVRLGQFVVDAGADGGTWSLRVGYNSGVQGAPVQFGDGSFSLPAPGALALLGLAGLAGRRRR